MYLLPNPGTIDSYFTLNVDIFAQCIFSRRALDARKFDVSENYNRLNGINWCARENLATPPNA